MIFPDTWTLLLSSLFKFCVLYGLFQIIGSYSFSHSIIYIFSFWTSAQRKLPSPGFQVEVVLVDYDAAVPARPPSEATASTPIEVSGPPTAVDEAAAATKSNRDSGNQEKDDVFSDNEAEETGSSKTRQTQAAPETSGTDNTTASRPDNKLDLKQVANLADKTEKVSLGNAGSLHTQPKKDAVENSAVVVSEFKAMAADASVFTFGDDEDDESD